MPNDGIPKVQNSTQFGVNVFQSGRFTPTTQSVPVDPKGTITDLNSPKSTQLDVKGYLNGCFSPTTLIVSVDPMVTIADLKDQIRCELNPGLNPNKRLISANIILRCGGKILDDNQTIAECNIHPNQTLDMGVLIQIYVKDLKGKLLWFQVEHSTHSMTVLDFKILLSKRTEIPPEIMRLIYAGRQLDDGETLLKCGISSESTLNLCLRLRGGMFHPSSTGHMQEQEESDAFSESLEQQAEAAQKEQEESDSFSASLEQQAEAAQEQETD